MADSISIPKDSSILASHYNLQLLCHSLLNIQKRQTDGLLWKLYTLSFDVTPRKKMFSFYSLVYCDCVLVYYKVN